MTGTRLYLGNLPYDTTKRDLESFFKGYGRIEEILLKNGYGFIEFDDPRDAEDAVYDLDGKKLLGKRVTVEMAKGKPRGRDRTVGTSSGNRGRGKKPLRTNYRVLIDNLSSRISWQDLKDHMREAGEVTYADAHRPYVNEAEVEFATYDDMKRAIKMFDGYSLNGRKITMKEDPETRRKRTPSRHRSYSRSESRSRSRSRGSRGNGDRSRSRSYSKSKTGGRKSPSYGDDRRRSPSYDDSRLNDTTRTSRSRSRDRSDLNDSKISRGSSPGRSSRSRSPEKKRRDSRSKSRSVERNGNSTSRSRSRSKRNGNSRSPSYTDASRLDDTSASRLSRSRSRSSRGSVKRSISRSPARNSKRTKTDENRSRSDSRDRD